MMFYIGTHMPNHAHLFDRCMISVNRLINRRSDIQPRDWIMDSGAFTRITSGRGHWPVDQYAENVERWSRCGNMQAAVTQDWMCEPFVIAKTGLSVAEHQRLTIDRFDALIEEMTRNRTRVYLMPVLQGFAPDDYVQHAKDYGDRLRHRDWCGIGSVCKRNGDPVQIIQVLRAIRSHRPDLRLHGFGLKETSLRNGEIRRMLHSADSMAWSYAARRNGRNANCGHEALEYCSRIGQEPATTLF